MRISHNLAAMGAYNALAATDKSLQKSISRLSTGLRINSASDDAAGLAISEKMRAQIGGMDQAVTNAQNGISLLHAAEGGLQSIHSLLQRMRELSVEGASDTLTSQDRGYIQDELNELKGQIDAVATTTQFNKKRLLDGSSGGLWASGDLSTKAQIRGSLDGAEGNYKIEIVASPGAAQVQKSNIIKVMDSKMVTELDSIESGETIDPTKTLLPPRARKVPTQFDFEFDIGTGVSSINTTSGDGWSFENGVLTITGDVSFKLKGSTTTNYVEVTPGAKATVLMENVDIDLRAKSRIGACPFASIGAEVDIWLSGDNKLTSGYDRSALETHKYNDVGKLTISSASGDFSTEGKLTAVANSGCGAAIGSACQTAGYSYHFSNTIPTAEHSVGEIDIRGGTIEATANGPGAGIGGGGYYSGMTTGAHVTVAIHGGNIKATAKEAGAGIGSGGVANADSNNVDRITITGGAIEAKASEAQGGAGIGGGYLGNSGTIRISSKAMENIAVEGFIDRQYGATISIGRGRNGIRNEGVDVVTIADPEPVFVDISRTLEEISQFYTADGAFMVDPSQTITIAQGDGKTARVTFYANDTLYDVAKKINNAIADPLGQRAYVDNAERFCSIADGTGNTSESVYTRTPIYSDEIYRCDEDGDYVLDDNGDRIPLTLEERLTGYTVSATMLVRSVIPGQAGELSFFGEEDFLTALGLNTIQQSSESEYVASVYDAHSGATVASGVKVTGNQLIGVIHPGVDVEFDALAGLGASWNEAAKSYALSASPWATTLHLANRGMAFQTGANQGEEFSIDLGDMSTDALGVTNVNVYTRENAARAVTTLDRAINRVSSQRAKVGAYENAMEQTAESLTTTVTNLTEAESRIRDADMAAEMMEFVRLQILNQSGTSMLAQANQLPQQVLSLIGG